MSLEDIRGPVEQWRDYQRRVGRRPSELTVSFEDAEALCDLADAARNVAPRRFEDGEPYCPGCLSFTDPNAECGCWFGTVRAALARLDGEDTG